MTSIQKSSAFTHDLNIIVEGKQFTAHWRILQENSLFFEEFYNRKESQQEKSRCRRKKIDSVHLKGISANLVEKFLCYVYTGAAREQRQLALNEVKDMLKIAVMFGLRDLRHPMSAQCLVDLKVNMEETGFCLASELHQALLRFLFDRTTIYKTKEIADFVACEAYKEASLECLLGVLKTVSDAHGTRTEMRLKLLDIVIALFSASFMDVQQCAKPTNDGARRAFPEGTTHRPPIGQRAVRGKSAHAENSGDKQPVSRPLSQLTGPAQGGKKKSEVSQRKQSTGFEKTIRKDLHWTSEIRKSAFSDEDEKIHKNRTNKMKPKQKQANEKPQSKLPRKAKDDERELNRRRNKNPMNGRPHTEHQSSKYRTRSKLTTEEKPVGACAKDKRDQEQHVRPKSVTKATKITQKTVVENEARIIRKRVRKQWTEQKTIPTIICSEEEAVEQIEEKHDCDVETTKLLIPVEEMRMVSPGLGLDRENQTHIVSNGWDKEEQTGMISCGLDKEEQKRMASSAWDKEEQTRMALPGLDEKQEMEVESHRLDQNLSIAVPVLHREPRQRIFLTGGIQKNDYFARRVVLEYDPINGVYIKHQAMETSRYNHGIAQDGRNLHVVGGNSGTFEQLRSAESYSIEHAQWSKQATMREARDEFSLAVCGGCLYAIGGHNGIHDLRTVEKFSVGGNSWGFVAPMKNYRAGACSVAMDDRYIYVTGGFDGQVYLNSVERYDITTNCWTEVEQMTNKRAYSCLVLCDHNMYVLGGFNGTEALSECEAYNTQTKTWSPIPRLNTPRLNATAVVFKDNIFIFGGESDSVFLETVECYDTHSETWSFVKRLPQPMAGLRACLFWEE